VSLNVQFLSDSSEVAEVAMCVCMWVCLGLFESSSHADSFDDCLLCCFSST
jgi:hypothetical protein